MGTDRKRENKSLLTRDQARSSRSRKRNRTVRSASPVGVKKRGASWLRGFIRVLPRLAYLALLILSGWLLYYSFNSPYFAVNEITVSGNRLLDAEQARGATGVLGRNLLMLRAEGIEQSVRNIAVVRDVRVNFALAGRVEIDVAERSPIAQWQGKGGTFLVDQEGVVFSRETPSSMLPIIVDQDGPAIEVGSRVDPSVLSTVVTLKKELAGRGGFEPWRFDFSRSTGVVVPMEGSLRVVFGDASDLELKLATLKGIQEHLGETKTQAESIDLRFGGRPTYVLAAPPKESSDRTSDSQAEGPDGAGG